MGIDLFAEYIKERESRDVVYYEVEGDIVGFATHSIIEEPQGELAGYLGDMYIREQHRTNGSGVKLLKSVEKAVMAKDLSLLYTSCDITDPNCDRSMKLILGHGFKPYVNKGNLCYFVKRI